MCLVLKAISFYFKIFMIFGRIRGIIFVVGKFFRIYWQKSVCFDNRTSDSLIDGRVTGQSFAWSCPLAVFGAFWFIWLCGCLGAPSAVSQRKTYHQSNAWASSHCRCPLWDVHSGHNVSPCRQRESPTWTAPSNNQVGFNNEQSTREQGKDF